MCKNKTFVYYSTYQKYAILWHGLLSKVPYSTIREQVHLVASAGKEPQNPKTRYGYFHAVLSGVLPWYDYTSSEHFAICFPLEMV